MDLTQVPYNDKQPDEIQGGSGEGNWSKGNDLQNKSRKQQIYTFLGKRIDVKKINNTVALFFSGEGN